MGKIQSIFRMLKAKSIYAMIYHRYLITQSSTKLQATFRMYKYKKKYEEHKSILKDQLRLKSVIVIQNFCRNYLKLGTTKGLRHRWKFFSYNVSEKQKIECATKLQSHCRKFLIY